jgi:molybdenum cofactor synthesis domain-containing protein
MANVVQLFTQTEPNEAARRANSLSLSQGTETSPDGPVAVALMDSIAAPDMAPGSLGEHISLSGLGLASLGLGSQLRVGSALLTVTAAARAGHQTNSVLSRGGVLAEVLEAGEVLPGDNASVVRAVPRDTFQAVVLTISDRCSRGEDVDTAGPLVAQLLMDSFAPNIFRTEIIPDEREWIARRLVTFSDHFGVDLIVTVGGTGLAPRDVTPEATRDVINKPAPGLDEAMRYASMSKTPFAMLSRGCSGVRGATLIVNLPGSERGAVENLEAIVTALPHGLKKLGGHAADCPCCVRHSLQTAAVASA